MLKERINVQYIICFMILQNCTAWNLRRLKQIESFGSGNCENGQCIQKWKCPQFSILIEKCTDRDEDEWVCCVNSSINLSNTSTNPSSYPFFKFHKIQRSDNTSSPELKTEKNYVLTTYTSQINDNAKTLHNNYNTSQKTTPVKYYDSSTQFPKLDVSDNTYQTDIEFVTFKTVSNADSSEYMYSSSNQAYNRTESKSALERLLTRNYTNNNNSFSAKQRDMLNSVPLEKEKTSTLQNYDGKIVVKKNAEYFWERPRTSNSLSKTTRTWKSTTESQKTPLFSARDHRHGLSTKFRSNNTTTRTFIKPSKSTTRSIWDIDFINYTPKTSKSSWMDERNSINSRESSLTRSKTTSSFHKKTTQASWNKNVTSGNARSSFSTRKIKTTPRTRNNINITKPYSTRKTTKSTLNKPSSSKPSSHLWESNSSKRSKLTSRGSQQITKPLTKPTKSWQREQTTDYRRNSSTVSRIPFRNNTTVSRIPNPSLTNPTRTSQSSRGNILTSRTTRSSLSTSRSVRTTPFKRQGSTKSPFSGGNFDKYSTNTPLPDINIRYCGIRYTDVAITASRTTNDPDAVILFPNSGETNVRRRTFQRIVGGKEAEPFTWPWVAALYKVTSSGGNRFLCAGSLINENFVLTAAHVFTPEDLRSSTFVVLLGTHTGKEAHAEYVVTNVLQHPKYEQRYYYYDIALLRLAQPVTFNDYVMPVCLPSPSVPLFKDDDLVGKKVTVMGWGDESFGGVASRVLKEATFPILSRRECNASYYQLVSNRFPRGITHDMLCAGSPKGGKDACQGDSGGPLTTIENGRYTQVGIVSFGYNCGDKDFPGVYTKISPYLSWIAKNARCDNNYYS